MIENPENRPLPFRSHSDAPWWLPPMLSFLLGVAVTTAVLLPVPPGSQFQRGHAAGYDAGWQDGATISNATTDAAYKLGFDAGKKAGL